MVPMSHLHMILLFRKSIGTWAMVYWLLGFGLRLLVTISREMGLKIWTRIIILVMFGENLDQVELNEVLPTSFRISMRPQQ